MAALDITRIMASTTLRTPIGARTSTKTPSGTPARTAGISGAIRRNERCCRKRAIITKLIASDASTFMTAASRTGMTNPKSAMPISPLPYPADPWTKPPIKNAPTMMESLILNISKK